MKLEIKLTLVGLLCVSSLFAQEKASGYVYLDHNGNGKRDKQEPGIAGVTVSNGMLVTTTDRQGKYMLPVSNDNILFVIKPAGYSVPLNGLNQPQYYYIHKPSGSPELNFKGSKPTGKLPELVNFALAESKEPENFTALIFGDPQAYTLQEIDFFAKGVVSEVESTKKALFGLSLGDLAGDDLSLHQPYIKAVSKTGLPWYNLIGNHDMNYDAVTDSLSDETFEANFGPANYAFNYGKAHFIVLDNILYPDPRDNNGYWAGFRKDQLDFITNDLKTVDKTKLIVLAFHIPLLQMGGETTFRPQDRQELFDLLKDFPNTLSISAHTHLQRQNFYTAKDGWRQETPHHEYNAGTTSGDWYSGELNAQGIPVSTMRDGTPKGYAFLNVKGNNYTIDYKVAGQPDDYQIKIYHPKVVALGRNTAAAIYANFFMGHQGNKVMYRVDQGEWKPMVYEEAADPDFIQSLGRWDNADELMAGRRPSGAEKSTHLWKGSIPVKLDAGEHNIEVKAEDMFGRIFTQKSSYRLEAAKEIK